jgi:hypothetical protein
MGHSKYSPELIPWSRAVIAGIVGALSATLFLTVCNMAGWTQLNLPFLVGSIFIPEVSPRAWNIGFFVLVLGGGPLAIFYRAFFKWGRHINIGLGLILGLFQWLASGLVLVLISPLSSVVPEQVPSPGPYGWSYDLGSFSFFLVANLLFGLVVTAIEQHRRLKTETAEITRFSRREDEQLTRNYREPKVTVRS